MENTDAFSAQIAFSQLRRARPLDLPSRKTMLNRGSSVKQFWDNNQQLLNNVCKELTNEAVKQELLQEHIQAQPCSCMFKTQTKYFSGVQS